MSMFEATRDIPEADVVAHRTRVTSDHELRHRFPNSFRPATDGPKDEVRVSDFPDLRTHVREPGRSKRTSAVPPRRTPTALSAEDQSRKALLRALREPNRIERIESTSGKLRRQFWEGAESLLDSLKSPAERDREWREAREDSEADEVAQALGRLAREQLEIDRIDEAWHWN